MLNSTNEVVQDRILSPTTYHSNTYDVVSKIGYLIGVDRRFYDNNRLLLNIFEEQVGNKPARIIRNLCILRTRLLRNYESINNRITNHLNNLDSVPEFISPAIINELKEDGLYIVHANWRIPQYMDLINEEIKKRISECRNMFPIWIKWDYIKDIFIISKTADMKTIWFNYNRNVEQYPYQMYINWKVADEGNVLHNDEKFIKLLYKQNKEEFKDLNKLKDASDFTKVSIGEFISAGNNVAMVVDCENANVYKLYSMLEGMSETALEKVKKIILYDDIHTSSSWKLLNRFVKIKVEHVMVERIKENKSLVDMKLAIGTYREYKENDIDSFILVSSDSDYWGLITEMSECRFLVMVERDKSSSAIINAMKEHDIPYCHIDSFCSGNLASIQSEALLMEMRNFLKEKSISLEEMFDVILTKTRVSMSAGEIKEFKKRYLGKMNLKINTDQIKIEIND